MSDDTSTVSSWFRAADKDGDGVVSGPEAVAFFQSSGLSKTTLAQVPYAGVGVG